MVDEPRGVAGLGTVHRHLAVQPERVAASDVVRQLAVGWHLALESVDIIRRRRTFDTGTWARR